MLGIAFQCPGPVVELLRNLASVRGVIVVSAIGEAVTILPAIAMGGGRGLFGLNNGCIKSCIEVSNLSSFGAGLLCDDVGRDVGREKLIGLDGGDDFGCRGDELQPNAVAVSEVAACSELGTGDSRRNGPSKTFAGDSGRLPG